MTRRRAGRLTLWCGAGALAGAITLGVAPFVVTALLTPQQLANGLGGNDLWALKGPNFVAGQLVERWHPWAGCLLIASAVLVVLGGWLARPAHPIP